MTAFLPEATRSFRLARPNFAHDSASVFCFSFVCVRSVFRSCSFPWDNDRSCFLNAAHRDCSRLICIPSELVDFFSLSIPYSLSIDSGLQAVDLHTERTGRLLFGIDTVFVKYRLLFGIDTVFVQYRFGVFGLGASLSANQISSGTIY